MTTWNLKYDIENRWWEIEGIPDTILIYRYPAGDIDTKFDAGSEQMHSALYDLHQVQDHTQDGDEFAVDGKVLFRVEGVHVVRVLSDEERDARAEAALLQLRDEEEFW